MAARDGRAGAIRALLIDVGGTLLPDALPDDPAVWRVRWERLAALLPELGRDAAGRLLDDLVAGQRAAARDRLDQRTDAAITALLVARDPALAGRVEEVRRALSRPTGYERRPFPGHRELLAVAGELGLPRVLVTNTGFISEADWWRWGLDANGLRGLVEGVVTSYDTGRRKPDRAMFDRAVARAGCEPAACLYVGDNEGKDVGPALALGMTVIRVAIQAPPTPTRAHRLVTDLQGAARALRELAAERRPAP